MNQKFSPLTERMKKVCDALKDSDGVAGYEFNAIRGKGSDCVNECVAVYRFGTFDAALVFNSRLGKVKNLLECRISLLNGAPYIDFSLYDLMYLLNENDFDCYLFPFIDSPDRIEVCIRVLFDAVMRYREQLMGIGADEALSVRAKNRKKKELLRFFKHDIFTEAGDNMDPILSWRLRAHREWYVSRFCSRWYYDYVAGNYARAAKRLTSFDSKCDYEIRIHRFLQTLSSGASYTPLSEEANTFSRDNSMRLARSRSSFVTTLIIGCACAFSLYMTVGLALYLIIYRDALYCTSMNNGWLPVSALLCAIPTGHAAAKLLWRRLLTKREWDALIESGADISAIEKRTRKGALHSSVICSLIIVFFAAKCGIALYDNGIVDNSAPLKNETMHFSDLKEIYYEEETGLYHLRFDGNRTFTCSSALAEEYILDKVDAEVIVIDEIEKES